MVRGKIDPSAQREIIIARKLFEDNKSIINSKDYAAFRGLKLFSNEHKERKNSSNSGFNQRKQLRDDAALFFNWDPSEPKSRNNITNAICSYAKAHHLQVEGDRRMLDLTSDAGKKLASLLHISSDKEKIPYCWIQKYTGSLFLPSEKVESEAADSKADTDCTDKCKVKDVDPPPAYNKCKVKDVDPPPPYNKCKVKDVDPPPPYHEVELGPETGRESFLIDGAKTDKVESEPNSEPDAKTDAKTDADLKKKRRVKKN